MHSEAGNWELQFQQYPSVLIRVAINKIVASTVAVKDITKVSVSINTKIKGGDAPIIRNNLISSFLSLIELSKTALTPKQAETKTRLATSNKLFSSKLIICQSSDKATPGRIANGSSKVINCSEKVANFDFNPTRMAVIDFGSIQNLETVLSVSYFLKLALRFAIQHV